jgi:hypothetical protein
MTQGYIKNSQGFWVPRQNQGFKHGSGQGFRKGPALDPDSILPSTIIIDGTPHTASIRYMAANVVDPSVEWPADIGADAPTSFSGPDPILSADSTFSKFPTMVEIVMPDSSNPGKGFLAPVDASQAFGTDDFVFETVFSLVNFGTDPESRTMFNSNSATTTRVIMQVEASRPRFLIYDSVGAIDFHPTTTVSPLFTAHHFMVSGDRDEASTNGGSIWVDGVRVNANVDWSARQGSLTSPNGFAIPHYPPFRNACKIGLIQGWHAADMFPGGASNITEMDALALARYNSIV